MWDILRGIQEQVTKYSTPLGQLWYLCVFVFRLIVVITIGGAVYGGELGEFSCSTEEPGCKIMCFNQFNKLSHIRFWSFQLLAIATPTVLFHFYSTSVAGQIQKLNQEQEKINDAKSEYSVGPPNSYEEEKEEKEKQHKIEKQKKKIGNVKFKKVYTDKGLQQVPFTNRIHIAYFINVILRVTLEAVFMYLAYQLFKFMDQSRINEIGPLDFIYFSVPAMYKCEGESSGVQKACSQAIGIGGAVPCWVSRPWEKTILIRYMNIFSGICFLLSAFELIFLTYKGFMGYQKQTRKRSNILPNRRGGTTSYGGSQHYQMTMRSVPTTYYPPPTMNGHHNPRYDYRDPSPPMTEHMPLTVVNHDAMSVATGVPPIARAPSMRTVATDVTMPPSVSMLNVSDRNGGVQRMNILPGSLSNGTRPSAVSNEMNNSFESSSVRYRLN